MASTRELKDLMKEARAVGFTIEKTRGDHLKWIGPQGGMPYFSSATPSDNRAVHNIKSALVKMGLPKTAKSKGK